MTTPQATLTDEQCEQIAAAVRVKDGVNMNCYGGWTSAADREIMRRVYALARQQDTPSKWDYVCGTHKVCPKPFACARSDKCLDMTAPGFTEVAPSNEGREALNAAVQLLANAWQVAGEERADVEDRAWEAVNKRAARPDGRVVDAFPTLVARLREVNDRIGKMCSQGRGPRMTVPVREEDDDIFICKTVLDAIAALTQQESEAQPVADGPLAELRKFATEVADMVTRAQPCFDMGPEPVTAFDAQLDEIARTLHSIITQFERAALARQQDTPSNEGREARAWLVERKENAFGYWIICNKVDADGYRQDGYLVTPLYALTQQESEAQPVAWIEADMIDWLKTAPDGGVVNAYKKESDEYSKRGDFPRVPVYRALPAQPSAISVVEATDEPPAGAGEMFRVAIDGDTVNICSEDDGNWFPVLSLHRHWLPELCAALAAHRAVDGAK